MLPLLSVLLLASVASINAQWNTFCGGAGYDVSSLIGRTLTYNTSTWLWVLAPCGSIPATVSQACASDPEAPFGSMFCQKSNIASSVYTLANWNQTVAQFGSQWVALANGVSLRVAVGERCPTINSWREVTIEFQCSESAIEPIFASIAEPETCWYVATIRTAAACRSVGPTMSNQVGASWYSKQCGGPYYDLSSLAAVDMHWDNTDYNYYLRVCGRVNNTDCAGVAPTSFCQRGKNNALAYNISDFRPNTDSLYSITLTGVDIDLKSGALCPGSIGQRQATFHLVCNPKMTKPIVSVVWEAPVCWYHAVIQTNAVCTGTNLPGQGYCGGAGYDLTELQTVDMVTTSVTSGGTVYNWYLHPCAPLSPWFTLACQGQSSMFCQQNNATKGTQNVATWNRTIAETATWMAITNGVQLYVQTGALCPAASNLPRDTAIQFLCDENARTPRFMNVTEPETCYYVAVILTEAACDTYGPTAPHLPGSTYQDNICGGNYLDLSDIRDEEGDLTFDTNPGASSGFRFHLELCGAVSNTNCSRNQPTMFCQVQKDNSNNTYSIAAYDENQVVQYTINENGITMKLQTGTPCGGIPRRAVSISIVCDGTFPAIISTVREVEVCHYAAIVHGRCDYGSTEPFSTRAPAVRTSSSSSSSVRVTVSSSTGSSSVASTGALIVDDSSKSSGLGGGAIAGIVIGSIVGGLILLAVLFVVCCGFGRTSKNSKFNEMERHEESRTAGDEVEMETA